MGLRTRALRFGVRSSLVLLAVSAASCLPPDPIASSTEEPPDAEEAVDEAPQAATITRRIPLRFIQLKDCTTASCDVGHTSVASLYSAVARTNEVFAAAGMEFWIKSNEVIHAPALDSNNVTNLQWSQVSAQIRAIYPNMPANAYPATDVKTNRYWLGIAAAYYGDPDVIHAYILDTGSKSFAQSPDKGRSLHLTSVGSYVLAHELGHYFGVAHTFEGVSDMLKPSGVTTWTRSDRWDLYYCTMPSMFFTSKADYVNKVDALGLCPEPNIRLIDTSDGDECTSGPDGDGPFECDLPIVGGTLALDSGDWQLQGLFREDPSVTHDPPNSFRYSANVMGYREYWPSDGGQWMSGEVPVFFSDSQLPIIDAYLDTEALIRPAQVQLFARSDNQPLPGDPWPLLSFRTVLGEMNEDFVQWANGDTASSPNTEFSFAYQNHPVSGTSYKTATGDFDGDGRDDILWCSTTSNFASILWGNTNRTFTADDRPGFCPAGFGAIRTGRFDNDSYDDILFYVPGAGQDYIKYGDWDGYFTSSPITADGSLYVPIVGNFDGALGDDIFWYRPDLGVVHRWYANAAGGFTHHDNYSVDAGGPFVPVVGNFDGALGDDIFWYKAGAGADKIWYSLGGGSLGFTKVSSISNVTGTYTPFAGDFDGDGKDDIFWEKSASTGDHIWAGRAQATQFSQYQASVYGTYAPFSGDFDGDGLSDIFWYRQ